MPTQLRLKASCFRGALRVRERVLRAGGGMREEGQLEFGDAGEVEAG